MEMAASCEERWAQRRPDTSASEDETYTESSRLGHHYIVFRKVCVSICVLCIHVYTCISVYALFCAYTYNRLHCTMMLYFETAFALHRVTFKSAVHGTTLHYTTLCFPTPYPANTICTLHGVLNHTSCSHTFTCVPVLFVF